MVERLRRLDWIFARSPVFFITACTFARRKILADMRLRECMMTFAERGTELGAWMGAFVLMPDHLHVFVALEETNPDEARLQLGRWMKALKRTLSKVLQDAGANENHWQKGFFDHVLRTEESYAEKWDYVRQNPIRAGLVTKPEDWSYFGEPFSLRADGL